MYNSTKAKPSSHAVRQCTSHTTFGVSMERVFGVTVQGQRKCLWTLVDPDMYMRHVDTFLHYSLCFPFLISSQKTLSSPTSSTIIWQIFPITTASYKTSPPYILLFSQHSPVICKDYFSLIYMYKSSRYYIVFHIDLGPMFPQSTTL